MREKKTLFIGNSHTYYNDMANMFKMLCNADENIPNVSVTMLASGGKTLDWHAEQPETPFNILYGEYDYIVLQQAAHPFGGKDELISGAKRLNEWIRRTDAETVAYMTWAEKRFPENQETMSRAYEEMAEELPCILAPVGRVWQDFRRDIPQIELYDVDGEHACMCGSFLAACVIYLTVFAGSCKFNFEMLVKNGGISEKLSLKDAEIIYEYCFKHLNNENVEN